MNKRLSPSTKPANDIINIKSANDEFVIDSFDLIQVENNYWNAISLLLKDKLNRNKLIRDNGSLFWATIDITGNLEDILNFISNNIWSKIKVLFYWNIWDNNITRITIEKRGRDKTQNAIIFDQNKWIQVMFQPFSLKSRIEKN